MDYVIWSLIIVSCIFHFIYFFHFSFFLLSRQWFVSLLSRAISLPVATQCLISKAKCDERIAKFVLSLGVTLNNNGTAMFLSISTVYIARMNGISLDFTSIIMTVITATSCSMSMPSVPGGSLLVLMIVLTAVDVSTQIVSLLFAIDWILWVPHVKIIHSINMNLFSMHSISQPTQIIQFHCRFHRDRLRTTSNVTANCFAAAIMEHRFKNELQALDLDSQTSDKNHQTVWNSIQLLFDAPAPNAICLHWCEPILSNQHIHRRHMSCYHRSRITAVNCVSCSATCILLKCHSNKF